MTCSYAADTSWHGPNLSKQLFPENTGTVRPFIRESKSAITGEKGKKKTNMSTKPILRQRNRIPRPGGSECPKKEKSALASFAS